MKRLVPLAFTVAAVMVFFPRLDAQNQRQIFTTGTPAELAQARALGLQRLRGIAQEKGIDGADDLVVTGAHVDRQSMAHTRVQQRFQGIPVLGGEAIAHMNADGSEFAETDNLVANINVSTTPLLTQAAAIDRAVSDYGCRTCLTAVPIADMWIVRDDAGVDHLTYRVQMQRKDGTAQTGLPVRFIDAQGGQVVLSYDNLQTASGSSLYSGTVDIGTFGSAPNFVMENHTLRIGTFDALNGTTSYAPFVDADNVWDTPAHRAAVDAHYGMEKYFAYLSTVHGRNGIDGSGGPFSYPSNDNTTTLVSSFVHVNVNYNNAFWFPADNSMNYGDGDGALFGPLVSLDIAGHEMTHGVTQFTANLIYHNESGALNESWSDVIGAMLERNVRGEDANTWKLGEEAFTPAISGDALRYLDDPHLGGQPDHYTERCTLSCPDTPAGDNGGVHTNSGIPNNAFYLLAHGGTNHIGGSMTGIGSDQAAQIWFTALTSYMTSGTDFAGARTATINAATALYGGATALKVQQAWCLVGVGACPAAVTVTAVSVTPNSGTGVTQSFTLAYTDSAGVAADLTGAFVRFTNVANPALMCTIQHKATTGQVRIMADDGVTWGPFTPYGAGTIANSQCSLNLVSSSAAPSGNNLSLNFVITFSPAFGGAANVSMKGQSLTGVTTGWLLGKGTWTVGGTVNAVSVTPNSGTGLSQTFTALFTDSLGAAADLKRAMFRVGAGGVNTCVVDYNAITATVRLFDDAGVPGAPASFGTASTLTNSQCTLDLASSSAAPSGNDLTLTLRLIFKPSFLGPRPIAMRSTGNFGANTGWLPKGTWDVNAGVEATSITPNSGNVATQTFSLTFSDSEGVVADLSAARVRFRAPNGRQCNIAYNAMTGTVRMLDDFGVFGAPAVFGSGVLDNSQCSVDLSASSASPSGTNLTLTLAITFKSSVGYSGTNNIDMRANSVVGSTTGWVNRGTWTVP